MAKRKWSDSDILELLQRIDEGYEPNEKESRVLAELESLDLSWTGITELPESIGRLTALKSLKLFGTKITKLPENIGQLTALESLDISRTGITELPESIWRLTALKSLDLSYSGITGLPESIVRLTALERLDISFTGITELPESIGRLTALESLILFMTKITELPESIGRLTALESLDISRTEITELPESIGQLTALKRLNLSGTGITELPESMGQLTALKSLDLSRNKITELPESIGQLTALEELRLPRTPIAMLPESMGELCSLKVLGLGGTRIAELPESTRRLSKLEKLYIWGTRITELPEWIGELPSLKFLDLGHLTLERIPRSLALKGLPFLTELPSDGRGILVKGTKLLTQDISVFLDTPKLIPSLYDEEQVIVPECKVIFLGNGEAGKTYTIRRIENEGAEETEKDPYKTKETPGVEISDYRVKDSKGDFKIHFWDFGGQDILHSMHRCFLTDNTCYAVMVKTRETNPDSCARFWLRNVKAFAPNSPVLLFINLWDDDDGLRVIDETRLKKDYPNIKQIVYCSAKKASQKEFREKVMESIIGMAEGYRDEMRTIPASFDSVRRKIIEENETKYILDKARYRQICEASGVEDAEAPALLTYLNRLGVCFSYHLNAAGEELKKYKLLKPIWLTNAIYAIIKEGAANASEGRIPIASVLQMLVNPAPEIIDGKQYTRTAPRIKYKKNEPDYVLAVAEAYSLCYRVDENLLFFPALCPTNSPKEALEEPEGFPIHAEYRFMYEYLPDSVVHKLMIRLMKKELQVRNCWHDGMVVGCWDEHRIIIRMVEDDMTLRVDIYSKEGSPACEAFPIIRREITGINDTLGLKAKEAVIEGVDSFPMAVLLPAFRENDEGVRGSASGKVFRPKDLLYKFYDSMTLYELEADEKGYVNRKPYQFHKASKDDSIVKRAIYEAYDKKCQYCGEIMTWQEMNIDHILPEHYDSDGDQSVEFYLGELRSRGFDTAKPNFIENYVPAHRYCNIRKSGDVRMVSTLREYHAIALQHTKKVLELIEKYKKECKPE